MRRRRAGDRGTGRIGNPDVDRRIVARMTRWLRAIRARRHDRPREDRVPLYFLHIPKTAGTSMRSVLAEAYGGRLCAAGMWDDFFRAAELRSTKFDAYSGHFGIDLPRFLGTRMRVFTMLRDPVARTVSHYLEVRRTVTHPLHHLVSKQTLRDFVFDPATVPMVLNVQARYLAPTGLSLEYLAAIFTPSWQARYTLSVAWENASCYVDATTLKEAAMSTLHSLEFVGVTEHFDDDLQHLQRMFGLPDVRPPRGNVSPREEGMPSVESDVEQRIRQLTSVDAALYAAAQSLRLRRELAAGAAVEAR
jgi:Sulfotransferase family